MTYVSPVMIAEAFFSRFEGILDTHIKVLIRLTTVARPKTVFNQMQFDDSELKFRFHCSGQCSFESSEEIWAPAKS